MCLPVFQVLLKPIISQVMVEALVSFKEHLNIPSVKEVDDLSVLCMGQMFVTARTGHLWKPLNHQGILFFFLPSIL